MKLWCWYCRGYFSGEAFIRSRPEDVRLYTGQRVAYIKHLRCKRKTVVHEQQAAVSRSRL